MIGAFRGSARQAEGNRRKDPSGYLESFGLKEKPFREARHAFLLARSESVGGALEKLLTHCRQGSEVVLATTQVPEIQHPLSALLTRSLDQDSLVVDIQADLLMSASEVLDRIAESLALATGHAHAPGVMIAGFREFLATQDGLKGLVVQVEDAHELGADVIESLVELAADPAAEGVLHVLLWGESYLWDSLDYLLAERNLRGVHVGIPALSAEDVSDYLEHCLVESGYEEDFPFTEAQIARIHLEAGSVPHRIDDLAEDELERLSVAALRKSRRFPLPHALAAGLLLAALGYIFLRVPDGGAEAASGGAGDTIVVPIASPFASPVSASAPRDLQAGAEAPPAPLVDESPADLAAPGQVVVKAQVPQLPPAEAPAPTADEPEASLPGPEAAQEASPPAAVVASAPAPAPALTELERHRARLEALPKERFLLQMMGSFSEDSAREYIAGNADAVAGEFYYFRSEYQNRPWYVVVYGAFASRQQAADALAGLPASLRQTSPWVRSAEEIRMAMAAR